MTAVAVIDTPDAWRVVAPAIAGAARIAVDLEADGFHRYPEHVALVQIALPDGRVFLIDPLALSDLEPLGAALADTAIRKVMHSADYDLRSLDRDFGFRVCGLFDTSIAAQMLGAERTGLANVLAAYLGVVLPKPKRLQRMDWSLRPLADDALAYAAGDVAHLFALTDELTARLVALDRVEWAAEECARLETVRYQVPDPPEAAFLAVPGAREMSDAARAVLRELFVWRDAEARRIGRPPFMLMPNETLALLAVAPPGQVARLERANRHWLHASRRELDAVLERGRSAPPVPWPRRPRGPEWTPQRQERLRRLKAWRAGAAERLGISAGIAWPVEHLKQIALQPDAPSARLDEAEARWVRRWQWRTLGASLEGARRDLGDAPPADAASPDGGGASA